MKPLCLISIQGDLYIDGEPQARDADRGDQRPVFGGSTRGDFEVAWKASDINKEHFEVRKKKGVLL